MNPDILQRFVSRRLLDIGADDTRLERVRQASNDLSAKLLETHSAVARYARVAFDPDIPIDEPVLAEVGAIVEKYWHTYRSCFADVPRQLYRAVALEALRCSAEKDDGIAAAIALLARNLLPNLNTADEKEVWDDLIKYCADKAEDRGAMEWDGGFISDAADFPSFGIKARDFAPIEIDRGATAKLFHAAAGPHNLQGQPLPNANPNWPNSPQPWAAEFSVRASNIICGLLEKAAADIVEEAGDLPKSIASAVNEYVQRLGHALNETLDHLSQSAAGLQRRSQLLWWKESAYSPSIRQSYRALPAEVAAVLMAVDLHDQVPAFCPESVEFFLREVVSAIAVEFPKSPKRTSKRSWHDVINEFVRIGSKEAREKVVSSVQGGRDLVGSETLVRVLNQAIRTGSADLNQTSRALGIDGGTSVALPDVAVWIFRELQAIRLTVENGAPNPTGGGDG